jgi:small subunit ribosomal protein S1
MDYNYYLPEGSLIHSHENLSYIKDLSGLERAMREDRILEANAIMCDEECNLYVDLHGIRGFIPHDECVLTQNNEPIKNIAIITRVGKPVCFKVIAIEPYDDTYKVILSRKKAQIECRNFYLSSLQAGDIIPATVTHLDHFGAFVDVGCGIPSLLSIDCISISRISHPQDRLFNGQRLNVAIKSNDLESGRIFVTLKELLGTWKENANEFCTGQTVSGIVRSIENYGVFVELAPNLAGLAEIKEDNPLFDSIEVGDSVSVYIKSILPDRMKIKLVLIDVNSYTPKPKPLRYFINANQTQHLDAWRYSPDGCLRVIETVF